MVVMVGSVVAAFCRRGGSDVVGVVSDFMSLVVGFWCKVRILWLFEGGAAMLVGDYGGSNAAPTKVQICEDDGLLLLRCGRRTIDSKEDASFLL
ncbi:hypothetical protein DEO72_LG3g1062 [Vigna unguiculata]|uniref:Uncharacterized protein n=1 Tax=Vigna unguiculata TaxID=3917 RepID=A0A4D6LD63_VIGUN|nr:hypothetical protein DEO72_LG3g1062 [Vigna unguiculata]